jgi:hypothetical protein
MMTVRDFLLRSCSSSPDGEHWEPALPEPNYFWWRLHDAWFVLTGKAHAIRQTTKADVEAAHGIKGEA